MNTHERKHAHDGGTIVCRVTDQGPNCYELLLLCTAPDGAPIDDRHESQSREPAGCAARS